MRGMGVGGGVLGGFLRPQPALVKLGHDRFQSVSTDTQFPDVSFVRSAGTWARDSLRSCLARESHQLGCEGPRRFSWELYSGHGPFCSPVNQSLWGRVWTFFISSPGESDVG